MLKLMLIGWQVHEPTACIHRLSAWWYDADSSFPGPDAIIPAGVALWPIRLAIDLAEVATVLRF